MIHAIATFRTNRVAAGFVLLVACSGKEANNNLDPGTTQSAGGSGPTTSASRTGGANPSGGVINTGGARQITGGVAATGTVQDTTGTTLATGGVVATGGGLRVGTTSTTGSAIRTGGSVATGGTQGTGSATSSAGTSAADGNGALQLAIPLYIWPGEGMEWSQVVAAGTAVSYIVANAGDPGGPGPSADTAYTKAIANAHQAGQKVVGYVDTSYANRALGTVKSEIDQWYSFYPAIDGIFLDLTPSEATRIADYYKPASDYVRAKPGAHVVIINPGQPQFDEAYMALADIAMSYENPYGSSSDGYAPNEYSAPSWISKYPAQRFWHVILEATDKTAMQNVLKLTRARNAGHVYVTNYADPPAYARLPTYFADEIAAVAR